MLPFSSVSNTRLSHPVVSRFALYPTMRKLSASEWRIYWMRVDHSFSGFFSEKAQQRWSRIAAEDAKAVAVRARKSSTEQEQAAVKATKMVSAQGWNAVVPCLLLPCLHSRLILSKISLAGEIDAEDAETHASQHEPAAFAP